MAKEPDNIVLRLLREIRSTQDIHSSKLDRIEKQIDDLYKISTTHSESLPMHTCATKLWKLPSAT
jgi:hypothetical protein